MARLAIVPILLCVALAQGAATEAVPVMDGTEITCLNKKLVIDPPSGRVTLLADDEPILTSHVTYAISRPGVEKLDWAVPEDRSKFYDKSVRKDERGPNHFAVEQTMTVDGLRWKQYRVDVDLMPDGLVKVTHQGWKSPDESKVKVKYAAYYQTVYEPYHDGWAFFSGDEAKAFSIVPPEKAKGVAATVKPHKDGRRIRLGYVSEGPKSFFIDMRRGVVRKAGVDVRGGIDFRKIDDLSMPDANRVNLMRNPSFECGWRGWNLKNFSFGREVGGVKRWKTPYFVLAEGEGLRGGTCLKALATHTDTPKDLRELGNRPSFEQALRIVPEKGRYTFSFSARASSPDVLFKGWCPSFSYTEGNSYVTQHLPKKKSMTLIQPLTTEWKRYSFSFDVARVDPLHILFNVCSTGPDAQVWIDDFMLAKGDATEYVPPMAEARLLTNGEAGENMVEPGEALGAELAVHAAAHASGRVEVAVKRFDGTEIFAESLPFACDGNGQARVALPGLEAPVAACGEGLFVMKRTFRIGDRTAYEYDRFTVVKSCAHGDFRWKFMANLYGNDTERPDVDKVLARYQKMGLFQAYSVFTTDKEQWDKYWEYGIDPGREFLVSRNVLNAPRNKPHAWGVNVPEKFLNHKDLGVAPDEAYFERFKAAAKRKYEAFPWIRYWPFSGEFFSEYRVDWWSKTGDPDEAAALYAKYLKAAHDALKEVDPSKVFMADGPCNMSESGLKESIRALTALNRLGAKVDMSNHHIYRKSPDSPDLEASILTMMKALKDLGYGDIPFNFGEGMHWGPYEVPAWDLRVSSWQGVPKTWNANATLSYDLGRGERLSAAWRARSWLVAFKYAPRMHQMNSGNVNNFALDWDLTPRLSQIVSATLENLLGNAEFRSEVKFAPYCRAYVFEDRERRPIVAFWCNQEDVDWERKPPTEVAIDLSEVICVKDLAGSCFKFDGRVTPQPRFMIGKPGSLARLTEAFRLARVTANRLELPFGGGQNLAPVLDARRVSDDSTLETIDWTGHQAIAVTNAVGKPGPGFAASYRMAWNKQFLFVRVEVTDKVFSHLMIEDRNRWENDSLQLYFDTLCNARTKESRGYDEDDYDYAVYPDAEGRSARVYRLRMADQQLGLGTTAPRNFTFADDMPTRFARTKDGYVYEVAFPAKYLLPLAFEKGTRFGFGILVNDANSEKITYERKHPKRRDGSLSGALKAGAGCYAHPELWPVVQLMEGKTKKGVTE